MEPSEVLDQSGRRALAPAPARPAVALAGVPDWAADAVLDQAFASWTPGPPPEAPAAEWEMARQLGAAGPGEDGDPVPTAGDDAGWARTDDDVLPRRRGRIRRRSRSRR